MRRPIRAVEDATDDDGIVALAVQMRDEDLAPDARQRERALARARPLRVDARPERLFVGLVIPDEAKLNAAVLVGRDLGVFGADDEGALDAGRLRALGAVL